MLENINPYNKEDWKKVFTQTDLYKRIQNDFDVVSFEYFVENTFYHDSYKDMTTRQQLGSSIFSGTIFYYLDYLLRDDPEMIYDIGCGWNIFKKYIPIIGYDPNSEFADTKTMPKGPVGKYVMAINSLHFTELTNIKSIVSGFLSKIEPGGKGVLTFNVARMTIKTNKEEVEKYIRTELSQFQDNLLVFDVNLGYYDATIDGNIRMVFSK